MSKKPILKIESKTIILDNLIKSKKLETETILIDVKNCEKSVTCFTRYVHSKSIKMLTVHCAGLIGNIEEQKYLMVDDYLLDKALDKIKE